ncbi:MAG: NADP-dependent malic enzyme [Chthonomonadales bacterium]|nr:NADP-dependent malic enzyme [Chthonomonadales bacterium]
MMLDSESLEYHSRPPAGKLEISPTKPCLTQHDLSLAYTPGVAAPCREIQADPEAAFRYTARGNLVAVITNGTAVLGLGNIGPLAGKPVMEGKALLFKRFADIDAIDLEVDTEDPEELIRTVRLLEPSFGGINLEDIRAPECFHIEQRLREAMRIPVFHDDQHGTAIISGAALLNALELTGREIADTRIVFSGAGAAALATARFYRQLGARHGNMVVCDRAGVIYRGRTANMNDAKEEFAVETEARSLAEALRGADVLIGLSSAGAVTADMLRSMARDPIVFAMANPDPEIAYDEAKTARPDAIVATGRSDYPNQVNNVLGFPFIFRGALDVRATSINEEMKVAAARSLAELARDEVPDSVMRAYGLEALRFGRDYLIPKPLDQRVLLHVAPAVAEAAMRTGVAREAVDLSRYREALEARLGRSREMMRIVISKARLAPRRIVLAEGEHEKMIRAAHTLAEERMAAPILLGDPETICARAAELQVGLDGVRIVGMRDEHLRERYAARIHELRCRKGVTHAEAADLICNPSYFGATMVEMGDADGVICGLRFHYVEALRPLLQIVGVLPDCGIAAGVFLVALRNRVLFFADAAVNIDPDPETLASIAIRTARLARDFDVEPRVAMLSFSTFGSVRHPRAEAVRQAAEIVRQREPTIVVEGEMQAGAALSSSLLNGTYPFNRLKEEANVLVFPNLEAGTIAYALADRLASAEVIGPILVGMRKAAHVVLRSADVSDIVNLAAIAVVQAQQREAQARREVWS